MKSLIGGLFVMGGSVAMAAAAPLPAPPIEVRVEVAEVDNLGAQQLGVEWIDQVSLQERASHGLVALGAFERSAPFKADIHFLIEEGAAELLANPTLVTDSGTSARFRAGGEIPYITTSSLGSSNVEFKPYGVTLSVRPRLLSDGRIFMDMNAGVSAPDNSSGVSLSGNTVPGLLQRDVSSHVTVDPGLTMTIAGLVQSQKEQVVSGVPILRKLPLLGGLFRWRRTNHRRTTIIIFVTPNVIQPNP
jgi:pilus assembly protein CpaC